MIRDACLVCVPVPVVDNHGLSHQNKGLAQIEVHGQTHLEKPLSKALPSDPIPAFISLHFLFGCQRYLIAPASQHYCSIAQI